MNAKIFSIAALVAAIGIPRLASSNDSSGNLLQVKSSGNVPYVSGGVGLDERNSLIALSHDDNLRLSFAMQDGHYLGGADVDVKDTNGEEILDAASDGPLFFAKLPAGHYTVEATSMGQTLTRTVNVPARGQTSVYFVWKKGDHQETAG
jgi:hypothetical protein